MSSKKNKKAIVPKRRFPEFKGEWVVKKVSDLELSVTAGATPDTSNPKYWDGGIRWMNSGELNLKKVYEVENRITELGLKESSTKMLPKFCVLIGLAGQGKTRGTVAMNMVELCTNQSIAAIHPSKNMNSDFLYHELDGRYEELRRISAGDGGRGGLNLQHIKYLDIVFPTTGKEQQKIADCLSSLDEVIALQAKKVESLKDYKQGLMQLLFPREGQAAPELRFSGFKGNWTSAPFEKVFTRITTKNAENNQNSLTISAQAGLISQLDFFNKKISAKDLSGYYLLHKGDFAYNKSYSQGYPMGAIKRLNLYEKGVVSTLYICFRIKPGYSGSFFEYYFDFGMMNNEISQIAQEGARNHGLLNIGVHEFFGSTTVKFPEIEEEQQKISDCLLSVDQVIFAQSQKLDALKEQKKGLMQQLFPVLEDEEER